MATKPFTNTFKADTFKEYTYWRIIAILLNNWIIDAVKDFFTYGILLVKLFSKKCFFICYLRHWSKSLSFGNCFEYSLTSYLNEYCNVSFIAI